MKLRNVLVEIINEREKLPTLTFLFPEVGTKLLLFLRQVASLLVLIRLRVDFLCSLLFLVALNLLHCLIWRLLAEVKVCPANHNFTENIHKFFRRMSKT